MRARNAVSGLVVCLLIASCTDGAGTTTTGEVSTSQPTTSSTGPGSTTTLPSTDSTIDTSDVEVPGNWSCVFMDRYVVVEQGDAGEVAEILTASGIDNTATSVFDVLIATSDQGDDAAANRVDGAIEIFEVDEPLEVVVGLRGAGFPASPIHVVAFSPHWAYKPGTDPVAVPTHQLPDVAVGQSGYIAVVDSGVIAEGPDWMSPAAIVHEDRDRDPAGEPSHGTFVSSTIRQIAPDYKVTFASAQPVSNGAVVTQNHDPLPANVTITSELQVAEGIARILNRHVDEASSLKGLNLSLGTYTCDPTEDESLVTTVGALGDWAATTASPVFAAAGNENVPALDPDTGAPTDALVPFWPAALAGRPGFNASVYSVGAIDLQGSDTVWEQGAPMRSAPRPWVTHRAPGTDMVGLAGATPENDSGLVCWSGSSFATAVAASTWASGGATGAPSAMVDYAQPGLSYFDPVSGMVITNDSNNPSTRFGGCIEG